MDSVLLIVVVIIFIQQGLFMFKYKPLYFTQVMRCYTLITCQNNRLKPKLTFPIRTTHMNMRWLIAFV